MLVVMDGEDRYYTGEKRRLKTGKVAKMTDKLHEAFSYSSEIFAQKAAQHLNAVEGRSDYYIVVQQIKRCFKHHIILGCFQVLA